MSKTTKAKKIEGGENTKVKAPAKKKILLSGGIFLGALLLIYLGFSVYFMSHFFFGTSINGMSISGYSVDKVKEKTESKISGYELEIQDREGGLELLKGADIDLELQWDDSIENFLKEQNAFAWPIKLFAKSDLENETVVSFNKEKLVASVEKLSCMVQEKQIMPVNATISEYSEQGYSIIPAQEGTAINEEALIAAVEEKIYGLASELSLFESGCYLEPEIREDDENLILAVGNLNQYLNSQITYQVGSTTKVLDKETFHSWLSLSDNLDVAVDEEQLKAYVKSLGNEFNTCYSAKQFDTSYGKTVTISNSHYGWKVDTEAEMEQILADLATGTPVTRDLNYSMTANSHEGKDYGNSYVEINLTAQHLFLYKNGELIIETDFVSGDISEGNGSPTGAFGITYKDEDATLKGSTWNSHVDYWMPFAGNVGMHDATWRKTFGAAIYKRNGSHGCINLPWSAAKKIFENVEANYPVLVYELPGSESKRGIAQDQAYTVIDAIKALGKESEKVTLEQESKVVEVRAKYDELSELAKSFVTNYDNLTKAEKAIETLKAEAEATQQEVTQEVTQGAALEENHE
ncbi:MAG: peptidoglycan binding domain-containing protein [Agathobacter sp.]|nr:peptidoglycan binding domain-containing protein [Agathobacter sp.]